MVTRVARMPPRLDVRPVNRMLAETPRDMAEAMCMSAHQLPTRMSRIDHHSLVFPTLGVQ